MNRRTFLVTLAVLGGGIGLSIIVRKPGSAWGADSLAFEVSGLLTARVDAQLIGKAYLTQAPGEEDPDRLVNLIFPALRSAGAPPAPEDAVRQVLQAMRQDFEEDRIVRIQGWMLSRTEARLCALIAMSG